MANNISIPKDSILISEEYMEEWNREVMQLMMDNHVAPEQMLVEHYDVNENWDLIIQCSIANGITRIVVPNEEWVPRYHI